MKITYTLNRKCGTSFHRENPETCGIIKMSTNPQIAQANYVIGMIFHMEKAGGEKN